MKKVLAKRLNVGYNKQIKKKRFCVDSIVRAEFRIRIYTIELGRVASAQRQQHRQHHKCACRARPRLEVGRTTKNPNNIRLYTYKIFYILNVQRTMQTFFSACTHTAADIIQQSYARV